jgi:UDP-N-acetyl-alpha-D-muramoyl-L-alanyl-L-glutamate epimerase
MTKFNDLRIKHPRFTYDSFSWTKEGEDLWLVFQYSIEPDISFEHKIKIHQVGEELLSNLDASELDTYVFNIGLSEMFSYWKTTASQEILVKAGRLDDRQLAWWHKLLIKGMGEFFFVNQIDFTQDDFVKISSGGETSGEEKLEEKPGQDHLNSTNFYASGSNSGSSNIDHSRAKNHHSNRVLVPVGGGKDSATALEIIKNSFDTGVFLVNPTAAALDIIKTANIDQKNTIHITRTLDPKIIEMNQAGYLNGHVPLSATLAFLSIFTADLFNFDTIAIANERSSNEGNVRYCDQEVNHQFSKTFEFEQDLYTYAQEYLPQSAPLYFSILRPLYELQIAKLFAQMPQYHQIFRSCNRGQRTNSWCGECSKCLFAYVILFPFIQQNCEQYFGKNLFDDANLWTVAQEILGLKRNKPFECVGTHEETICAFYLCIKKHLDQDLVLPVLLERVWQELQKEPDLERRAAVILDSWNDQNLLPDEMTALLRGKIEENASYQ